LSALSVANPQKLNPTSLLKLFRGENTGKLVLQV